MYVGLPGMRARGGRSPMRWLVKLRRGDWETVLYGFKYLEAALGKRDELNNQYQTDEYYVEAFQAEKLEGFGR